MGLPQTCSRANASVFTKKPRHLLNCGRLISGVEVRREHQPTDNDGHINDCGGGAKMRDVESKNPA